jgi:hypothetical protein
MNNRAGKKIDLRANTNAGEVTFSRIQLTGYRLLTTA